MTRVDPADALERVVDEATFLQFVEVLVASREPGEFGRGPDGWENETIESFLEAAARWAVDSDFGASQGLSKASPWKRFAVFLYCGMIYE